ncbi:TPA: 5'-nucleotidase C-terminal domain-containing protein, partial [Aeromonas veronii]
AALSKQIRDKREANLVFAITHMGHYADGQHGSNAPGDVEMARKLPVGTLDGIIGGHSQNPVCMEPSTANKYNANFKPGDNCQPDQQNGTWIMQAHEWGKYVGRAQFEFQNGKLTLTSYDLIPVNLKGSDGKFVQDEIIKDPELYNTLLAYQEQGQEKLNERIGDTDGLLIGNRSVVRAKQTNLGRLITTATASRLNTDFGIVNSGGVRDDIPAGEITYRSVLKVHPFGNQVNRAEMQGSELATYLGQVATKTSGSGGYAQFGGIEMVVDCQAKSVNISRVGGKAFDPAATYSFAIPSYSADGGDSYPKITTKNAGLVDADVLKNYIQDQKFIYVAAYEPKNEVSYINSTVSYGCK